MFYGHTLEVLNDLGTQVHADFLTTQKPSCFAASEYKERLPENSTESRKEA